MIRNPLEFYYAIGIFLNGRNKPSFFHRHPTTSGHDVYRYVKKYIEDMEYCEYKTRSAKDAESWKTYISMNITNAYLFGNAIDILLKMKLCK